MSLPPCDKVGKGFREASNFHLSLPFTAPSHPFPTTSIPSSLPSGQQHGQRGGPEQIDDDYNYHNSKPSLLLLNLRPLTACLSADDHHDRHSQPTSIAQPRYRLRLQLQRTDDHQCHRFTLGPASTFPLLKPVPAPSSPATPTGPRQSHPALRDSSCISLRSAVQQPSSVELCRAQHSQRYRYSIDDSRVARITSDERQNALLATAPTTRQS